MSWEDFIVQAAEIVKKYRDEAPEGFDPKASVVSGTLGAVLGSDASKSASDQNATNIAQTNAQNLLEYQQSRGSGGSAIYPLYANGAEQELYSDALSAYDATGAISPTASDYQNIVNGVQPIQTEANDAAAGIFNGATTAQEVANQAPVYQANLTAAATQKQGTLEALQQTLNNIKSIQAGKGYAGDSFQNSLLNFTARQGANTTSANQVSAANVGNAQTIQGIKEAGINRQLSNLNLPGQIAGANINLAQAPESAVEQNQVNRQNLFSNFRVGTGQPFQYQNLPTVQPTSAAYGALASAGAGGNSLANAYIKNPTAVTNMFGGGSGGGVSTSYPQPADSGANSEYAGEGAALADENPMATFM